MSSAPSSLSFGALKGPRADLVLALKGSAGLTARVLIERLGLSPNAVRHHLKELEAAGLMTYERQGGSVGAPSHRFHLTPAGEALFPRRYEETVTRLLDHVVEHEGRAAAVEVLETKYREMAARLRRRADRCDARGAAGRGDPRARRGGLHAGSAARERSALPTLVEHNCPMQQVAERFPELCEAEARFLAEVLEAEVTRASHIASGCGSCEYQIHRKDQLAASS